MKIFNSVQIKNWDIATLQDQNISSFELTERAATACFSWLLLNCLTQNAFQIFCGKGNNGGDGLALARILIKNNIPVSVYILETGKSGKASFQENLTLLHGLTSSIHFIQPGIRFPVFNTGDVIIDALFGTGLNKPVEGIAAELINYINENARTIVAIDIPSGLFADKSSLSNTRISATHTCSFQNYKFAFFFAENSSSIGKIHLLDIGLSHQFTITENAIYELLDKEIIQGIIKPRNPFTHKGNYGHAALLAGSVGMMGAAVLAAKACLASGTGKLTCFIPACGLPVMQITTPEAMCKVSGGEFLEKYLQLESFTAIGIGPGLAVHEKTAGILKKIFSEQKAPLLLDADALNLIAADEILLQNIPANSIITPHPKEFERLFGKTANDIEMLELAIKKAATHTIYIVLKGHHTAIITPLGKVYFNNTGNAGMAKGGMGDVLTGIITGLMGRNYPLPEAAILGVYLHGVAGDIAAEMFSQEAMQSSQLIACMGEAWKKITV